MVVDKNKVYVPPVPIAKMNLRCEDKECLQNLMSPYSKSFGKKNESSASCLHGAKFSTYRTCVGYEKKVSICCLQLYVLNFYAAITLLPINLVYFSHYL